jgi:DNA (cytosine-5)-methyltransferase 1
VNKYLTILESAWQEHLAEREPNAPTVISTFAGCGGSSLGYSMAGFRELLANEWDDNAVQTFKLNFPDVPVIQGDIAKLTVEQVLELTGLQPGELDVFDGSPPCQGFSTAGKRVMDDPRNQLFREYVRLLRGLKPKVFVMENVSGMVKGKMKLIFADILRELKASGYKVSARLLNAMYFNVPQSRQRLIFIGVREDLGVEPSHPKAESRPFTVRDAIGDLPTIQDASIDHIWIDEVERKTKWGDPVLVAKVRPGGKIRENSTYIRLYWDKPSNTLTKAGLPGMPLYVSNCHIHPTENRALSVREFCRLASFHDKFVFANAIFEANARIGNSVPPLFMRSIARHIRQEILGS